MISSLNKRLEKQQLKIKVTAGALDFIVAHGADAIYGARPLKRYIQQEIEDRIAEKILLGELEKTGDITLSVENNQLNFKSN